jgi:hypothetical protein
MADVLFGGPTDPPEDRSRVTSTLRVLITVKAAPNPSASYGETVCVAGLRLDAGHEGWVRLYPINFRFIEQDFKFRKYDVVTLTAAPASEGRYESWRPRIDTLHVETHLNGWQRRMPYLAPFARATMCDLRARALDGGPSLGLVRAHRVLGLQVAPHPGWTDDEKQKISDYINQAELFDLGKPKSALEAPRFIAHYRWECPEPGCRGHVQQLLDWEFSAFQRRLPSDHEDAVTAVRHRWLEQLCSPERQVYFYVGNQAKRHQTFSILGVVYPRR